MPWLTLAWTTTIPVSYTHLISLAYALPRFGLFVGQNVAQLLGVGSTADFVRTTAVAFFLLYLILMVIWMVNSHERKRAESQARAADELLGRFAQEQELSLIHI